MKTLWSSSSKVYSSRREKEAVIASSQREILGRNEIRFLSSTKKIGITFSNSNSVGKHKKRNQPVYDSSMPSSSAIKEPLPDEQENPQIQATTKTVNVRFQLQRMCSFGEQFLLLGDDTMLGSWAPLSAIPLDWSEGDIWSVELDIPVGKEIKYKFILKQITGDILWQPGPDRVIQAWETMKMISIFEDWENSELQVISEEESLPKNIVDSGTNIITENITDGENSIPIIPEDIAGLKDEATVNINNKAYNDETVFVLNNGRAAAFSSSNEMRNEENMIFYESVPVLVPGLAPISTIEIEEKSLAQSDDRIADKSSSHEKELKELGDSEPEVESPHSADSTETKIHIQEQEYGDRQTIKHDSDDLKGQSFEQIENVIENDIQWGRTTLQKLLNSFGF